MGLAASQSRFLLLTSRKNRIASQVMSLNNQNLALQRQQAILAADYNKKQNAETITYNGADLDYSSIMSPNTSGENRMLTSSAGEVLLNNAKASKLGFTETYNSDGTVNNVGTGEDFLALYGDKEGEPEGSGMNRFINQFIPNYTRTLEEEAKEKEEKPQLRATSAFKYDDSIMNDALVSVSAATVLGLGGYNVDSEGKKIEGATLDYAMGTQQNNVNSLAAIKTLDQYQYSESNVHSVANEFVYNASNSMAQTIIDNFGNTDAINKALTYARKMTQEKYANGQIYSTDMNIQNFANLAQHYNNMSAGDAGNYFSTIKDSVTPILDDFYAGKTDSQLLSILGNQASVNAVKQRNYDLNSFRKAYTTMRAAIPMNTTDIIVSTQKFDIVTTTNLTIQNGTTQTSTSTAYYNGKDVFVNTAQLTATFLTFFDAEMNRQLGTEDGKYYGDQIEQLALSTTNMLSMRKQIEHDGILPADTTDWNADIGALAFSSTVNSNKITVNPDTSQSVGNISHNNLVDETKTNSSTIPNDLISAARAAIGLQNYGSYNGYYQPVGTSSRDVWAVLGNDAKAKYDSTGIIEITDPSNGLVYSMNAKNYAKDLPSYYVYTDSNGGVHSDVNSNIQHSSVYYPSASTKTVTATHILRNYSGCSTGKETYKSVSIVWGSASYKTGTDTQVGNKTNSQVLVPQITSFWQSWQTKSNGVYKWTSKMTTITTGYSTSTTKITNGNGYSTGPYVVTAGGQTYAAQLKVYDQWADDVAVKDMKISNPLGTLENGQKKNAIPDFDEFPKNTTAGIGESLKYKEITLKAGETQTVWANAGDMLRFSTAAGVVEYSLNPDSFTVTDANGNKQWTVTNHSNVSQKAVYYQSAIDQEAVKADEINIAAGGGNKVIGQIGNGALLSSTFSSGAAGIFGSKNLSTDDYKNLVSGSSYTANSSSGKINQLEVEFYKSLYSALATGGWKIDSKVNNSSYLGQQVLQGNVVLHKFNNTVSWKALQLGDSSAGFNVKEDKEGREKAKVEYEAQNSILETRMKFLENQIDTLNTQSEAIDSEKESLQSLIDNEQEKFKLFTG